MEHGSVEYFKEKLNKHPENIDAAYNALLRSIGGRSEESVVREANNLKQAYEESKTNI